MVDFCGWFGFGLLALRFCVVCCFCVYLFTVYIVVLGGSGLCCLVCYGLV